MMKKYCTLTCFVYIMMLAQELNEKTRTFDDDEKILYLDLLRIHNDACLFLDYRDIVRSYY